MEAEEEVEVVAVAVAQAAVVAAAAVVQAVAALAEYGLRWTDIRYRRANPCRSPIRSEVTLALALGAKSTTPAA